MDSESTRKRKELLDRFIKQFKSYDPKPILYLVNSCGDRNEISQSQTREGFYVIDSLKALNISEKHDEELA